MLPASSSGPAFQAVNTFHLQPDEAPPPLQPHAVYTYGRGESFNQVNFDIAHNLCTPFKIRAWALWLEPADEDADNDAGDGPVTSGPHPAPSPGDDGEAPHQDDETSEESAAADDAALPMATEPTEAEVTPAAFEMGPPLTAAIPGTPGSDGPAPHPDAMPFDIIKTFQKLPPHLQRDFQSQISAAMQMGVEYFQMTGLSEAEALNEMRTQSWAFLRDMTPLEIRRAKRQRYYEPDDPPKGKGKGAASRSSIGWY